MEQAKKFSNPQAAFKRGNDSECPVCRGGGLMLVLEHVEGYGVAEFAVPCSRCGKKKHNNDLTGVPKEFYDATLERFDFKAYTKNLANLERIVRNFETDFETWRLNGKGLYLWSRAAGSGKTFLACTLAKDVMIKRDLKMRFVTAPDYLAILRQGFSNQEITDKSAVYRSCDLLVLDDVGSQKPSDWQGQEIFRLVDERLNNGLITIYTSNYAPEQLNYDNRTISRIQRSAMVLQLPEESIRDKKAKAEQAEFLERVLKQ